MEKPSKITLEELREGMSVFLHFPSVEEDLEKAIERKVESILLSRTRNGSRSDSDVLSDYLAEDTENRLKIILGICGSSFEKLKRVYENYFVGNPISDIGKNESIRRVIAQLFCESSKTPIAKNIPPFIIRGFTLPNGWRGLLQDRVYLETIVSHTLQAKYSVTIGMALEGGIRRVVDNIQIEHEKGRVEVVDNKEVDVVIPNRNNPQIIIMSSYQLTTSSSQSSKANEQARIYDLIQGRNRSRRGRGRNPIIFVNVIDGGGWLSRSNDLEQIWEYSDYCFAASQLFRLEDVIRYYYKG